MILIYPHHLRPLDYDLRTKVRERKRSARSPSTSPQCAGAASICICVCSFSTCAMCVSVRAPLAPPVRIHGEVIAPLSGNRETFSIDSDPHQSMMRDGVTKGGDALDVSDFERRQKSREKSPLLTLYLKRYCCACARCRPRPLRFFADAVDWNPFLLFKIRFIERLFFPLVMSFCVTDVGKSDRTG